MIQESQPSLLRCPTKQRLPTRGMTKPAAIHPSCVMQHRTPRLERGLERREQWFNGEANSTEGLLLALYVSNICVDGVTTTPEYLWSFLLISVDGSSRTFWLCSRNFVLYWIRLCRGPRGPARIMSRVSVNSI